MPEPATPGSALAARCTACATVFRVVPDQLRVSNGWVRCGRCAQVFNAAQTLIDLDTGAPRSIDLGAARLPASPPFNESGAPPSVSPAAAPAALAPPETRPSPAAVRADDGAGPPASDSGPVGAGPGPGNQDLDTGAVTEDSVAANGWPAVRHDAPAPAPAPASASSGSPGAAASAGPPADSSMAATPMPSFLRQADRAARWRRPGMRRALGTGCVLAGVLLLAQAAHAWRDQAAARFPGLRPALEAGCRALGCQVGPARAIENLSVESSALLRVEQSTLYQLTVSLRNRASVDLALPALELSLTDAQGRLLSRRVLRATELGAPQPSLAAGRDLALQATLLTAPGATPAADAPAVAGYTIELFYP